MGIRKGGGGGGERKNEKVKILKENNFKGENVNEVIIWS